MEMDKGRPNKRGNREEDKGLNVGVRQSLGVSQGHMSNSPLMGPTGTNVAVASTGERENQVESPRTSGGDLRRRNRDRMKPVGEFPPSPALSEAVSGLIGDLERLEASKTKTSSGVKKNEGVGGCKIQMEQIKMSKEYEKTSTSYNDDNANGSAAPRPGPSHSLRPRVAPHSIVSSKQRSTSDHSSSESLPSSASTADSSSNSNSDEDGDSGARDRNIPKQIKELNKNHKLFLKLQADLLRQQARKSRKRKSIKETTSAIQDQVADQRKKVQKKRKLDIAVVPEPLPEPLDVEGKLNAADPDVNSDSATATTRQEAPSPKSRDAPETDEPVTVEEITQPPLDTKEEKVQLIKCLPVKCQWDLQGTVNDKRRNGEEVHGGNAVVEKEQLSLLEEGSVSMSDSPLSESESTVTKFGSWSWSKLVEDRNNWKTRAAEAIKEKLEAEKKARDFSADLEYYRGRAREMERRDSINVEKQSPVVSEGSVSISESPLKESTGSKVRASSASLGQVVDPETQNAGDPVKSEPIDMDDSWNVEEVQPGCRSHVEQIEDPLPSTTANLDNSSPLAAMAIPSASSLDPISNAYKESIKEKSKHIEKYQEKLKEKDNEIAVLEALSNWTADGDSQLHLAISQNDIKLVKELLQNGADVSVKGDDGGTPLHRAAKVFLNQTSFEIIKTLIENGSKVFSEDKNKMTFLPYLTDSKNYHTACTPALFHEITAYLLGRNTDYIRLFKSPRGDESISPSLKLAVKNMDLEEATLQLLYTHGLNFKAFSDNDQALIETAVEGGRTPAFLATLSDFLLKNDIVNLEYIRCRSKLILLCIAAKEDSSSLSYFLELGLDTNVVDDDSGGTLLQCALKSWNANVLDATQMLILAGADCNAVNNLEQTALHIAALSFKSEALLDVIKLLMHNGADPFKEDGSKSNFLHHLVLNIKLTPLLFHELIVHLSLQKYLRLLDNEDENGDTPLGLALKALDLESRTLTILQGEGVLQPEKFTSEKTMDWLCSIVLGGNVEALQFLILNGWRLDVNAQENYYKNSLLHEAVLFGQKNVLRIVQTLINAEGNLDLKNKGGLTLLDIAMRRENLADKEKIVHLLSNGALAVPMDEIVNDVGTQLEGSERLISYSNETDEEAYPTSEHSQVMNDTDADFEKKCEPIEPPQLKMYKEAFAMKNIAIKKLKEEIEERKRKLRRLIIIKHRNKNWETQLHLAVQAGDEQAVMELVLSGATLNAMNDHGETPLHKVFSQYGQYTDEHFSRRLRIAQFLIENKADLLARNTAGKTALCELVIKKGRICWTPDQFHEIVELILEQNIVDFFNSPCKGLEDSANPFQWSLQRIDVQEGTLSLLLRNHADFNAVAGKASKSVLSYAIEGGRSLRLIENLVKFGANPHFLNDQNETMLHVATRVTDVKLELLKYLLALGLKLNARDIQGRTPLHNVLNRKLEPSNSCTYKLVQFLITNGANPDITDCEGRTPLFIGAGCIGDKGVAIAVIKYLIANGANPFTEVGRGETFLYELVDKRGRRKNGKELPFPPSLFHDLVQYLVENNYSQLLHTRKQLKGETKDVLELAVEKGSSMTEATLSYLEEHGQLQRIRNRAE